MTHLLYTILLVSQVLSSSNWHGPQKNHPHYCPGKWKINKKYALLHHEIIKLTCPCSRLIPEYSLYPKTAAINWFFRPFENSHNREQKYELIYSQDPPKMTIEVPELITKGGGLDYYNGATCSFPFVANFLEHYECIDSGRSDGKCFCGIQVKENNLQTNLDKKKYSNYWGFCSCAKPINNQNILTINLPDPPKGSTDRSHQKCHFPFIYKKTTHYSCITDSENVKTGNRCFCGLVENLDENKGFDHNYGYCPCASGLLIGEWTKWSEWSILGNAKDIYKRNRICKSKSQIYSQIPHCEGYGEERKIGNSREFIETDRPSISSFLKSNSLEKKYATENFAKTLILNENQLSNQDSGVYICSDDPLSISGQHILNHYDLHIIDPKISDFIVLSEPGQFENVVDFMLDFDTSWSDCDLCGKLAGEKRRFGLKRNSKSNQFTVLVEYQDCHMPCPENDEIKKGFKTIDASISTFNAEKVPKLEKEPAYKIIEVNYSSYNLSLNCHQLQFTNQHRVPVAWVFGGANKIKSRVSEKDQEFYIDQYDQLVIGNLGSFIKHFLSGDVVKVRRKKDYVTLECYVGARLAVQFDLKFDKSFESIRQAEKYFDVTIYWITILAILILIAIMIVSSCQK